MKGLLVVEAVKRLVCAVDEGDAVMEDVRVIRGLSTGEVDVVVCVLTMVVTCVDTCVEVCAVVMTVV